MKRWAIAVLAAVCTLLVGAGIVVGNPLANPSEDVMYGGTTFSTDQPSTFDEGITISEMHITSPTFAECEDVGRLGLATTTRLGDWVTQEVVLTPEDQDPASDPRAGDHCSRVGYAGDDPNIVGPYGKWWAWRNNSGGWGP